LLVALAAAIAPLALLAAINPRFGVGPFTAVLVLLAPTVIHVTPLESAVYRVLEVALGATIGLGVSYLVFPARAQRQALGAAASMLDIAARGLPDLLAGLTRPLDARVMLRIQNGIGEAFAHLPALGEEAARERIPYFAATPDLGPLLRTLLRLRHDLVMIGRAAQVPLPEPLRTRLEPLLARIGETVIDYLGSSGAALRGRRGPPSRTSVDLALCAFAAEIAALRRESLTRDLSTEQIERIFVLSFALEQLHRQLEELGRSVEECSNS
jgi:uncharacterized membrane protein YccC